MKILPLSIKLGSLFIVVMSLIIIFSLIYWKYANLSIKEAVYNSIMTQTMTGSPVMVQDKEQKSKIQAVVSIQCILAYFITSGLLIISLHSISH